MNELGCFNMNSSWIWIIIAFLFLTQCGGCGIFDNFKGIFGGGGCGGGGCGEGGFSWIWIILIFCLFCKNDFAC